MGKTKHSLHVRRHPMWNGALNYTEKKIKKTYANGNGREA